MKKKCRKRSVVELSEPSAPPSLGFVLDPWQEDFLNTSGDKILCTGRQVGKSVVCGIDAGRWAMANAKKTVLMIAPTERQAYALFEKTLGYIARFGRGMILKGRHRPTKSKISLINGTIIWCLPTGLSGLGIRFLTVDRLYADEASRIPEAVFDAVSPMMLTTGGDTIFLSTPFGVEGYFYDALINRDGAFGSFTRFRTDSETVVRERQICASWSEAQRDKALQRLAAERGRMSALAYAQEYMGQPLGDLKQVFPDKLLEQVMVLSRRDAVRPGRDYFAGIDIAGMGGDLSAWVVVDATNRNNVEMVDCFTKKRWGCPERVNFTRGLNEKYRFSKIGLDDGGLGSGDLGFLLTYDDTKRKVVALNNASRELNRDGSKKKRLLKEDMYNHLLALMEWNKIKLLKDDDVYHSLRSIQFEIERGRARYNGSDSHITEALIRAAWLAGGKGLNIYIW